MNKRELFTIVAMPMADVELLQAENERLRAEVAALLEALKKLASIDFGSHGWDEFAESAAREARAAIAKAEGTTP